MKKFEKWEDEITRLAEKNIRIAVRNDKPALCKDMSCRDCDIKNSTEISCINALLVWLYKEYEEPKVDWSKVEIDTPILVSLNGKDWEKRHFAKYENGKAHAWNNGSTSFTAGDKCYTCWNYAKLAEVEIVK